VNNTFLIENQQSDRLFFRRLTLDDIPHWTTFASNKKAMRFFDLNGTIPLEFSESWIKRQLARYDENGFGLAALIEKKTGEFVGQCGLLTQDVEGKVEIEIGYSLMPDHTGKGFATEAAVFCKNFAFARQLTDTLISLIHPENTASANVAVRNGMVPDGRTTYNQFEVVVYRVNRDR